MAEVANFVLLEGLGVGKFVGLSFPLLAKVVLDQFHLDLTLAMSSVYSPLHPCAFAQ
jgi:hypothetical protein